MCVKETFFESIYENLQFSSRVTGGNRGRDDGRRVHIMTLESRWCDELDGDFMRDGF